MGSSSCFLFARYFIFFFYDVIRTIRAGTGTVTDGIEGTVVYTVRDGRFFFRKIKKIKNQRVRQKNRER